MISRHGSLRANLLGANLNVGSYSALNAFYVGKHGSDVNDGRSMARAKLTIASAVAAATAAVPSSTNRFVIYAEDAGIYAEAVVLPEWVSLDMRNAKLEAPTGTVALTIAANCWVRLNEITGADGQITVLKAVDGNSAVDVDALITGVNGFGAVNLGLNFGFLYYLARLTMVGAGSVGVGDISANTGHMHVWCEDVYVIGAGGVGVARLGDGSIVGRISHVLEIGAGVGAGSGIVVLGGEVDLDVGELITTAAYNVSATGTLRLDVREITGTRTEAAGSFVEINGVGQSAMAVTPFAVPAPTSGEDRIVLVDVATIGGPSQANLPATPALHGRVTVKDATGGAGGATITVSGNGNAIDGAASAAITTAYGSVTLAWDGTAWRRIAAT